MTKGYCISDQLVKIAKLDKRLADVICEKAHENMSSAKMRSMPLNSIIRFYGGAAAAQLDMKRTAEMDETIQHPDKNVQACIDKLHMSNPSLRPIELIRICDSNYESGTQETLDKIRDPLQTTSASEDLKRTYKDMGFNTPSSSEPGNKGVPDTQYDLSHYQTVSECAASLEQLGVDSSRALDECKTYFNNDSSDTGKKSANIKRGIDWKGIEYGRHLRESSNNICSDTKNYYSNVCKNGKTVSASVEREIEAPSWAVLHHRGELPKSTSHTTQIKSAAQQRDDTIYNYITYRSMSHADDHIPYNAEIEKMIEQKGEQLRQAADSRLRQAKKQVIEDDRPAWVILHT